MGSPQGVVVKALDCGIIVSEIELLSRYYIHFWTNTPVKAINPLFSPI